MKKAFPIFYIITFCFVLLSDYIACQNDTQLKSTSKILSVINKNEDFETKLASRACYLAKFNNYSKIILKQTGFGTKLFIKDIDTLNYPLVGNYALYVSSGGGYVTGNNEFGDIAKANFFQTNGSLSLTGIIFDFAVAKGGDPEIEIAIWDNDGLNNSPGSIVAVRSVNLNTIKNDIANQQKTFVPFEPPVELNSSFYAGIVLPTTVGDTLAIWSNTDGDTNPGIAWEKWNTGVWYPMSSNETWSRDIAMAVFPIVIGGIQIETDTLNYPLAGVYDYYYIPGGGGYVTGNNVFGDLAKANYFSNNQNRFITGVLMKFAIATGGNPNVEIGLWDNSGANGSPGAKIGSNFISLNAIASNINSNQLTYVGFDPPIHIVNSFYAGFVIPTNAGDTLVILSNTDGNTDPSTAWELWNTNQWYSFNDTLSWDLKIALAVFPIVQNTLGIEENNNVEIINVFPNPSNGNFFISTKSIGVEPVTISVYKNDGTLIKNEVSKNTGLLLVNLSDQPSGIYLLKLKTTSKSFIKRLVKP